MATDPILDLSTLIPDRPVIRIDGATFHLRSPDELTLAESHRFGRWGKDLEALAKDPERLVDMEALLRRVSREALADDVAEEVFARLGTRHHLAIVEVFTVLLLGRQARLAGAVASAAQSTGPRSFPASSMSSAATPDGGSTEPRPRSSAPI